MATPVADHAAKANEKKAGKPAAPPDESKKDKFVRLALGRTNKALKAIKQIANLGNARQYEYTPQQGAKIVEYLKIAVNRVEKAFAGQGEQEMEFKL
jgi:hypothetical protein